MSAHLAFVSDENGRFFQMLHVKVVEARGLMARDGLLGRSDPYVKLDLTGRYAFGLKGVLGERWETRRT